VTAKKTAGHSAKHVSSAKHTGTSKHSPTAAKKAKSGTKAKVTTKAKAATHAKAVSFAVGDWLPVCAFEALAQSLRLAGGAVSDEDVLELSWLAGGGEIAPASILGALAAAFRFGLAGIRSLKVEPLLGEFRERGIEGAHDSLISAAPGPLGEFFSGERGTVHGLILRIDQPGSHAVLATPDGWWSWGELYSPWPARVGEAWAVSWS
jgi:hypothetical protein